MSTADRIQWAIFAALAVATAAWLRLPDWREWRAQRRLLRRYARGVLDGRIMILDQEPEITSPPASQLPAPPCRCDPERITIGHVSQLPERSADPPAPPPLPSGLIPSTYIPRTYHAAVFPEGATEWIEVPEFGQAPPYPVIPGRPTFCEENADPDLRDTNP
jgi:hypothetical protein